MKLFKYRLKKALKEAISTFIWLLGVILVLGVIGLLSYWAPKQTEWIALVIVALIFGFAIVTFIIAAITHVCKWINWQFIEPIRWDIKEKKRRKEMEEYRRDWEENTDENEDL